MQHILRRVRIYQGPITGDGDQPTLCALGALIERENLSYRYAERDGLIDKKAAAFLLKRFGSQRRR